MAFDEFVEVFLDELKKAFNSITVVIQAHHVNHEDGGIDEVNIEGLEGNPKNRGAASGLASLDASSLLPLTQLPDHASNHENGGGDEIDVAGLSGLLADDQHVLDAEVLTVAAPLVHASRHENTGDDEISLTGLSGDPADVICDSLLTVQGDLITRSATVPKRLALGTQNYFLKAGASEPGWSLLDGYIGEGHITIVPINYSAIGQGTWIWDTEAAQVFGGRIINSTTHADGDNISYKVYLDAGTYTLQIVGKTASNIAITDIDVNGVEVASFDWYGSTVNNAIKTQTNISISSAGIKTLTVRGDGRNASSTNNYIILSCIVLWRTA